MELLLENVRCFTGRHEIPIRPLTLLVGENSTGKTTVLAMLHALSQGFSSLTSANFNEAPYELGHYATISSRQGRAKKAKPKEFRIGYQEGDLWVNATYVEQAGQPVLAEMHLHFPGAQNSILWTPPWDNNFEKRHTFNRLQDDFQILPRCRSMAPVRSRPRRTYDPISEEFQPEGEHIPFLLSRILREKDHKQRQSLLSGLLAYGQESGLFESVSVRNLGEPDHLADPFQVQVTLAGHAVNLIDVGYGVSQALPVIVESVLSAKQRCLLLQQPEVHLHPRAQAALGTFFATLVGNNGRQFVIETHSDYLLDRVRQEVAKKTLKPKDVMILYFERHAANVTVHPIELDSIGNIMNPPLSYRQFFIDEDMRLLTRGR